MLFSTPDSCQDASSMKQVAIAPWSDPKPRESAYTLLAGFDLIVLR
jgi:hypothetical protein